jgi:hypothetical protein
MYNEAAEILIRTKMVKLPGVGVLLVDEKPAIISAGEHIIQPPTTQINFIEDGSVEFDNKDGSKGKIIFALARQLKGMQQHDKIDIGYLGYFQKSDTGDYVFTQNKVDYPALSSLTAERVIRKEAVHEVTVGDNVRSSAEMSVPYEKRITAVKNNWWIFALILALISIALIIYYYLQPEHSDNFGLF